MADHRNRKNRETERGCFISQTNTLPIAGAVAVELAGWKAAVSRPAGARPAAFSAIKALDVALDGEGWKLGRKNGKKNEGKRQRGRHPGCRSVVFASKACDWTLVGDCEEGRRKGGGEGRKGRRMEGKRKRKGRRREAKRDKARGSFFFSLVPLLRALLLSTFFTDRRKGGRQNPSFSHQILMSSLENVRAAPIERTPSSSSSSTSSSSSSSTVSGVRRRRGTVPFPPKRHSVNGLVDEFNFVCTHTPISPRRGR